MAFNNGAVLNAIKALLLTLPQLQSAQLGAPDAAGTKVSAYVTLGAQPVVNEASGGLLKRETRCFVGFAYRVAGADAADVATAETTLAAAVDAFIRAFYADRSLGGVVESAALDLSVADQPEYRITAGKEYRIYPLFVTTTQRETIPA